MQAIEVTIRNEHGLHARPAGMLVKACTRFEGTVRIGILGSTHKMVDGKSLLGVLKLAAKCGDVLLLQLEAASEAATQDFETQIKDLAASGFGE